MCDRFFDSFANKVGEQVVECSCLHLRNSCKKYNKKNGEIGRIGRIEGNEQDFQFSNKEIREIFVRGELDDIFTCSHTHIFRLFDYHPEFVSMAICYLHEGNIDSFFELLFPLMQYDFHYHVPESREQEEENERNQKILLKKIFLNHLECLPENIFDNFRVHVGFGDYNERDILQDFVNHPYHYQHKHFSRIQAHQEYILVSLKLWLFIFFSEEKPRSFFHNMFINCNKNEDDPYGPIPDIPFSRFLTLKSSLMYPQQYSKRPSYADIVKSTNKYGQSNNGSIEKLVEKLVEKTTCECTIERNKLCNIKNFKYTPKNIRNILPTLETHHQIGMLYSDLMIPKYHDVDDDNVEEGREEFRPEFLDMAMCYFHEENFVEFFNIISRAINGEKKVPIEKIKDLIFPHIKCISLTSVNIKKYNVNIDLSNTVYLSTNIYEKDVKRDRKIKKDNEDMDDFNSGYEYTDHERFNCVKNNRYLNIPFTQWLSDILTVKVPLDKWMKIWKRR